MRSLKDRLVRLGFGLSLATTLALGAVVPALADGDDNALTITGDQLTIGATVEATSSANLTGGGDKTATYDIDLNISDARGTGDGWSVTLVSTQFVGTAGAALNEGGTAHVLATTASRIMSLPSASCVSGSTCALPNDDGAGEVAYPYTVPAGGSATPAVAYRAIADSGMGNMIVTLPVEIALPAGTTYAGTYTSTITVDSAATP